MRSFNPEFMASPSVWVVGIILVVFVVAWINADEL